MTPHGSGIPPRVVLDANTIVSAVIGGTKHPPAGIRRAVDAALGGASTVLVCPHLLDEVERVLGRPKVGQYVEPSKIPAIMTWILAGSHLVDDPVHVERICRDPDDDYVLALAKAHGAALVSGDGDILSLDGKVELRIMTPREYLDSLG